MSRRPSSVLVLAGPGGPEVQPDFESEAMRMTERPTDRAAVNSPGEARPVVAGPAPGPQTELSDPSNGGGHVAARRAIGPGTVTGSRW